MTSNKESKGFSVSYLQKLKLFSIDDIFIIGSLFVLTQKLEASQTSFALIAVLCFLLASVISFSVHNAAIVAEKIGPSLGTLLLALSVTVIEVAFIINMMKSSPETAPTIARDAVFAALMILTNGTVGISLWLGGLRHKELGFQSIGTSSLMGSLATLAALTLVLPNYTTSSVGPTYDTRQLIFISITAIVFYVALVWAQTNSYKSYFLDTEEPSSLSTTTPSLLNETKSEQTLSLFLSFVRLCLSLICVIGLAKLLSPTIELGLNYINAPRETIGIVIALLVLAPESIAALQSAKSNQLQTSLNLALGSGAASIALTIPAVSWYAINSQQPLILGIDAKNTVFLLLTFLAGGFSFGAGRATALHGLIHLVILFSYLALSFMP